MILPLLSYGQTKQDELSQNLFLRGASNRRSSTKHVILVTACKNNQYARVFLIDDLRHSEMGAEGFPEGQCHDGRSSPPFPTRKVPALKQCAIVALFLGNNALGDNGVTALASGLAHAGGLQELHLNDNEVSYFLFVDKGRRTLPLSFRPTHRQHRGIDYLASSYGVCRKRVPGIQQPLHLRTGEGVPAVKSMPFSHEELLFYSFVATTGESEGDDRSTRQNRCCGKV